jgi:hypothetical protein
MNDDYQLRKSAVKPNAGAGWFGSRLNPKNTKEFCREIDPMVGFRKS